MDKDANVLSATGQENSAKEKLDREKAVNEAMASGNSVHDPEADWVDYQAAGVQSATELNERALQVLSTADMERDIYEFGLQGKANAQRDAKLVRASPTSEGRTTPSLARA